MAPLNNLQRHYWELFQTSNDYIRQDRHEAGLELLKELNLKPDLSILLSGFIKVALARYLDRRLLFDRQLLLDQAKPLIDRLQPGLSDDAQVQFLKGYHKETSSILARDKEDKTLDTADDDAEGSLEARKARAIQITVIRDPPRDSPADTEPLSSVIEGGDDDAAAKEVKEDAAAVDAT